MDAPGRLRAAAGRHELPHPLKPFTTFPKEQIITSTDALLIVGSGPRIEHVDPLVRAALAAPLVAITDSEPTWERPHLRDWEGAPGMDLRSARRAAAALARRHHLTGVLTFDESHLQLAAQLSTDLGLPGHSTATAAVLRDRDALSACFDAAGLPRLAPRRRDGVVPETAADPGAEIAVTCVTHYGRTTPITVTRTHPEGPTDQLPALSVEAADPLLALVGPLAVAALDALGASNAVTTVAIRIEQDGTLWLTGAAGCLSSTHGLLVRHATGIDLARAAAEIACGRAPELTQTRHRAAAAQPIAAAEADSLALLHTDPRLADPAFLEPLLSTSISSTIVVPIASDDPGTWSLQQLLAVGPTAGQCLDSLQEAATALTAAARR